VHLSPDSVIYWQWGVLVLNKTIVFTWVVMALLALLSRLATRRLSSGRDIPAWQNVMESIVVGAARQIKDTTGSEPERLLPLLGTFFLFIAASNVLSVVPGFDPPTGSLSTTAALALCVFAAVPAYGVSQSGLVPYLGNYVQPTPLMLPFNIIGDFSRILALAVRLFGNVMSGSMIGGILLIIAPLFVPVLMQLFGLLTGLVQAYIFAMLAAVYIGAGLEVQEQRKN